jgi:flagellin-specific chaperone FliS
MSDIYLKNGGIIVSEKEEILLLKTSTILKKDTSMMKLNDIIEELVSIIELNSGVDKNNN